MTASQSLRERLADRRGNRVVFLSHCLLNENTRYLGGACHSGCVPEIVDRCTREGLGVVQMPCPEQRIWGGVLKRHLLATYGAAHTHPMLLRMRHWLLFLGLAYTRVRFRRLARRVAREIADYIESGMAVVGIVGVDGSPSCGVAKTIDPTCVHALAELDQKLLTTDRLNECLLRFVAPGPGIFIDELQRELARRRIEVPFSAHDLLAELASRRHIAPSVP